MLLQRQHFLLSYFETLSVGSAGVELTTSRMAIESPVSGVITSGKKKTFRRVSINEKTTTQERKAQNSTSPLLSTLSGGRLLLAGTLVIDRGPVSRKSRKHFGPEKPFVNC